MGEVGEVKNQAECSFLDKFHFLEKSDIELLPLNLFVNILLIKMDGILILLPTKASPPIVSFLVKYIFILKVMLTRFVSSGL